MKHFNIVYRYKKSSTDGTWTSGSRTVSAENETMAQTKLRKELGSPALLEISSLREV
jgi:hypothetical protein